jgi:hypothetical protein
MFGSASRMRRRYAILLPYLGFYTLTPFFAAAFLFAAGERRWRWIIGVSMLLYVFMIIAFARLFYVGLPVGTVRPFYDFSNWLLVLVR